MQVLDEQQVLQNLAYQAWLERGQPFGSPEIDWQRAQQLFQLYRQDIATKAQESNQVPELTDVAIAGKPDKNRSRARASRARNAA